jgi:hypothetical protein
VKKNWTKIALALGPVIFIASLSWEYARTNPEYNFLVQPWSIRGYETTHGWIIATMGVLLLIGGLLTSWEGSMKPRVSAAVTVYLVVAATAFVAFFTLDTPRATVSLGITPVVSSTIAVLLAAAISLSLRSLLREKSRFFKRALPSFAIAFLAFFFLFGLTINGTVVAVPTWAWVLGVFGVMAALSVSIKPNDVAANRMLIFTSVAAWGVVVLSAGAIRESLITAQNLFDHGDGITGVAAQYKDTQAASGWWLAGFGATVIFVGAVGLWAKRRDIVAALARARKQREAAEKSAREIAEALEAYEQDQAGTAAASQP